jgi:thiosulfate/3-mercaptopyruvate sulfurtransferase
MSRLGITPETTVVLYGDSGNWWAAYVFWVFQLFHHRPAKLMDGGRLKWLKEGRALTQELTLYPLAEYSAVERDDSTIRARREEVIEHAKRGLRLVDVRSREEYAGVRLHIPDYPDEGALRGGHIPGASNVLWSRAIHPGDGSFRSANELKSVYVVEQGFRPDEPIIAYCRIGERSSHTWFVLTYLLGFQNVRNYDGGWVEWGNLVNVPIERLRR